MTRLFPLSMLVASALCLSLGIVMTKHLVGKIDPIVFLAIQLGASVLFLWSIAALQGAKLARLRSITPLIGLGSLIGAASICTIFALRLTTASQASLIFATQPVMIVALAWPLLNERPTYAITGLSILALLGVAAVVGGTTVPDGSSLAGSLAALASTAIAAFYVVWMRKLTTDHDPLTSLAIIQSTALLVACAALPIDLGLANNSPTPLAPSTWSAIALSGLLEYGLGYWLYLIGLRTVRAGAAGLYLNLCPLFVIALAYVFLGEVLTIAQWFGAATILFAVTVISLRELLGSPNDRICRSAGPGMVESAAGMALDQARVKGHPFEVRTSQPRDEQSL